MSTPSTPNLRAGQVEEVLKDSSVVVIHAWGSWDGKKAMMDRVLSEIAPTFSSQISFYSMDVDVEENFEFLHQHKVLNVPALICFKNGMYMGTSIGLRDKQLLIDLIESISS